MWMGKPWPMSDSGASEKIYFEKLDNLQAVGAGSDGNKHQNREENKL